jgi:hypothetical protein
MKISNEHFKECLGSFASGVTIVTMIDASNEFQAVTISSFSSLSLEPPMISFNLGKSSNLHNKIINSDAFAVNILSQEQALLSRQFAGSKLDKWHGVEFSQGVNGCPIIKDVSAFIECLTGNIYDGGDHSIITGRVVNLKFKDGSRPLVYYMGGYYYLGEKIT